ncbi:MAG: metal-dependent hydrolase [Bacillota bacterium]
MAAENKVRWIGHSAFEIITGGGMRILIDPWITGNPACPDELDRFSDVDLLLITHDHFDHKGEDIPFLTSGGATAAVQPEVLAALKKEGLQEGVGMNIGGTVSIEGVEVTMVQAFHSSTLGAPCGYILTTEDGKKIYHAGDTGIFSSMSVLGDMYDIDLAMLPIGSVYVMDPVQASFAVQMLRPKKVIPMHYGTFPALVGDPGEFSRLVAEKTPEVEVCVLKPGEETTV